MPGIIHHDVAALDVAMDDPLAVRILKGATRLHDDVDDFVGRWRAGGDQVGQRPALDVLHHDIRHAGAHVDVADRDDSLMRHARGRSRLLIQPLRYGADIEPLGRVVTRNCLHGHGTVQLEIAGAIDDPHGALAEDLQKFVTPAGRPNGLRSDGVRCVTADHRPGCVHVVPSLGRRANPRRQRRSGVDRRRRSRRRLSGSPG